MADFETAGQARGILRDVLLPTGAAGGRMASSVADRTRAGDTRSARSPWPPCRLPPVPGVLSQSRVLSIQSQPYMVIEPALALALTLLALNFVGDGLRDALDPWMNR